MSGHGSEFGDSANVSDKAHVEHAVGLVEDESIDIFERELFAFYEIHHAAGGGDDDMGVATEFSDLAIDIATAD